MKKILMDGLLMLTYSITATVGCVIGIAAAGHLIERLGWND